MQLLMIDSCCLALAEIVRQAGQVSLDLQVFRPPPEFGLSWLLGALGWGSGCHLHFQRIKGDDDVCAHASKLLAKLLISLSRVCWLRCEYVNTWGFFDFFYLRARAYNVCTAQLSEGHVSQTAWAVTWKLASLCSAWK